jgi:hypothetical protein
MMQADQAGSQARQVEVCLAVASAPAAKVEVCLAVTVEDCWVAGTVVDYWAAATVEEYLAMVQAAELMATAGEEQCEVEAAAGRWFQEAAAGSCQGEYRPAATEYPPAAGRTWTAPFSSARRRHLRSPRRDVISFCG